MKQWKQDTIQQAWNFASQVHVKQKLPGSEVSYLNHLGNVAMEAMAAIAHSDIDKPELLLLCAILHDTIEDTDTDYQKIHDLFGESVAKGVQALSKDDTLSSKEEKMQDSLARIKKEPREVWMVKLCDRITNLQKPPHYWTKEKIEKYRIEARLILTELGAANEYLATRLQEKINSYTY